MHRFKICEKWRFRGASRSVPNVMSARDMANPESFKVRKGAIGGYRAELMPESIAFVDQRVSNQLNPVYGYGGTRT